MEIYLIRHTSVRNAYGVCYGISDVELECSFSIEAQKIKKKISNPEELTCYSSPLQRCLRLAQVITSQKRINITDQLLELNFGEWELKRWNRIPRDELNHWMESFIDSKCPQGESYQDLYLRTLQFWKSLIFASEHKRVGIVTHASPIRVILSHVLNISLKDSFSFRIDVGSISKLSINPDGHVKVHYTNC
jgi:alpha-ribazole phosphatase